MPKLSETTNGQGPITDTEAAEGLGEENLDLGSGVEIDDEAGDQDQQSQAADDSELQGLLSVMRENGLKSPEEVAAFLKNLKRQNTELGQKLRQSSVAQTYLPPVTQQPPPPQAEALDDFADLPEDAMELISDPKKWALFRQNYAKNQKRMRESVREEINRERNESFTRQAQAEIQELIAEDQEKFSTLHPLMIQIANHPNFARASLRQIYDAADRQYAEIEKKQMEKVKKNLGLNDIDPEKLRALIPKARAASLSSSPGNGKPAAPALNDRQKQEKAIKDSILRSNKLRE